MSLALIGALVGLAFAGVEYFVFGALIQRALQQETKGFGPNLLDLTRKAQIILFPVIGYIAGLLLATKGGVT